MVLTREHGHISSFGASTWAGRSSLSRVLPDAERLVLHTGVRRCSVPAAAHGPGRQLHVPPGVLPQAGARPGGAPGGERPSAMGPSSHLPDPPLPALCSLPSSLPCLLPSTAMLHSAEMHALQKCSHMGRQSVLYSVASRSVFLLWHDMILTIVSLLLPNFWERPPTTPAL